MTDKEIIAKRIINGLECCDIKYPPCAHCPYQFSGLNLCKKHLIGDAYYLVKTQQSEIERLKNDIFCISNERDAWKDTVNTTASAAIKEFADKLKLHAVTLERGEPYVIKRIPAVLVSRIDNLVKEMVGADNG